MRTAPALLLLGLTAAASAQAPGTWAWDPPRDTFSDESLLDLRHLNEDVAGEHGFIGVDERGDFVRGNGEPIRFWAVTSDTWKRHDLEALREHAKFLAKRGVNNVRYHGNVRNPKGPIDSVHEEARDGLWRLVAAMKEEGVYVTLSPYYAHNTPAKETRPNWALPRDPNAENLGSLLFFDQRLQDAYKAWLRQVLEPVNPYTGIPLKDDPALAILQIQNEDSLLFWTFNNLGGQDLDILRRKFGDWLRAQHGSLQRARDAWGGVAPQGERVPDDWGRGLVGFSNLWAYAQPDLAAGNLGVRMRDEVEFLTHTMRSWNAEVERFLREEIGSRHLVNAGNWRTADPLRLSDLERYSYTPNRVMGLNRYTSTLHTGEHHGWAIHAGQRFRDASVLLDPDRFALALKQPRGYAFILPEGLWVPPNVHQSEGPLLVAAYSSLTGVDAYYWFATREVQWREPSSANGFLPSLGKWVFATPELLGNFPAAALIFRKGYIQRGEPVVVEHRDLDDLWRRKPPIISEEGSFDPNRDAADITDRSPVRTAVDRRAFLVGPVEVVYDSDPAQTHVADLAPFLHDREQVIESNTGELRWDHGTGIVTVDAPCAQAATGFLGRRGELQLSDVAIDCGNAYATVAVVSMDGEPLASSGRVLVQVGTTARPTGWETREATVQKDGADVAVQEIVAHGGPPWRIAETRASVTIHNAGLTRATLLDASGVPARELDVSREGGVLRLALPGDAKYVVLR